MSTGSTWELLCQPKVASPDFSFVIYCRFTINTEDLQGRKTYTISITLQIAFHAEEEIPEKDFEMHLIYVAIPGTNTSNITYRLSAIFTFSFFPFLSIDFGRKMNLFSSASIKLLFWSHLRLADLFRANGNVTPLLENTSSVKFRLKAHHQNEISRVSSRENTMQIKWRTNTKTHPILYLIAVFGLIARISQAKIGFQFLRVVSYKPIYDINTLY